MIYRKLPLLSLLLLLFAGTTVLADLNPNRWYAEGEIERDGHCIAFKILAKKVNAGMPSEYWEYRILEGNCDGTCMEEVYRGPLSLYGGDVPIPPTGSPDQLPITVTPSGTGYVSVPIGSGGTLAPGGSSYPTCDAVYTTNGSSVLVIESSLLN